MNRQIDQPTKDQPTEKRTDMRSQREVTLQDKTERVSERAREKEREKHLNIKSRNFTLPMITVLHKEYFSILRNGYLLREILYLQCDRVLLS